MPTIASTFIHLGNFADLDPDETNYSSENPGPIQRSFSKDDMTKMNVFQNEHNGDGQIAENDNGQFSDSFSYDLGGGWVTSNLDSAARYSAQYVDENGVTRSTTISVYQTESGEVFAKFPNGIKLQSMTIRSKIGDGYSSIRYGTSSNAEVVCFASGTMIATPSGLRRVQDLAPGDLVDTLDHGACPLCWLREATHPLEEAEDGHRPILISAGALGDGLPGHDLIVSQQHRILLGGQGQGPAGIGAEMLVPARALTALPGIRVMRGKRSVTWVHFAFAGHEIVRANGCWSESLLLGRMVLNGVSPAQRQALHDMYGRPDDPTQPLNGPAARPILTVGQAHRLLNGKGVGQARQAHRNAA